MVLDDPARLLSALKRAQWIVSEAADALGVSRQAIYNAMRRYGIKRQPIPPGVYRAMKQRAAAAANRARWGTNAA